MIRIALLWALLLFTFSSFLQQNNNSPGTQLFNHAPDSLSHEDFSVSLDAKSEKLIIPAGNDSLKLIGIKIFSAQGEELLSHKINNSSEPTTVDISNLADSSYIVHIVTDGEIIYRTKFIIRR